MNERCKSELLQHVIGLIHNSEAGIRRAEAWDKKHPELAESRNRSSSRDVRARRLEKLNDWKRYLEGLPEENARDSEAPGVEA
jgi:hypothetical protein